MRTCTTAEIQSPTIPNASESAGKGNLHTRLVRCHLVQPPWKIVWRDPEETGNSNS